jgi:hypothetical protein
MKNIYFNVEKTFDLSENFNISNQTTCLFGTTSGSPVYLEQLVVIIISRWPVFVDGLYNSYITMIRFY